MNDQELKIQNSAAEAVKVIAAAAGEATKVVANAAAESAKILSQMNAKNSNDHDLIIVLDTKMDGLKDDIQKLNDGTNIKISDHEQRIKVLETTNTKLWAYGTALIFVVGLAEFFISKFWK